LAAASGISSSRHTTCNDYDAQQPLVLIDTVWKGRPRKLLVQATATATSTCFDRTTGEYLLGTQYVKNVTWASV